ncbi:Ribonuclease HI [Linum grandiflorum]
MERERDAFYVVRKGDLVGVYKSFPQVSDPSVRVYKGYGLPRAAEEYLVSHGIANAAYSISVDNVDKNLFGQQLERCRVQPPAANHWSASNRSQETQTLHTCGVVIAEQNSQNKYPRLESRKEAPIVATCGYAVVVEDDQSKYPRSQYSESSKAVASSKAPASLYFDGASKGNPGPAGAGAVLCSPDGRMVWRLCEGVGIATNNVAEYRGLLLGLKQALKKGFIDISVQGDSNLVCMQIQGIWKVKNKNLANVGQEARNLKDQFRTFQISHIPREFNAEADALANQAVLLRASSSTLHSISAPNSHCLQSKSSLHLRATGLQVRSHRALPLSFSTTKCSSNSSGRFRLRSAEQDTLISEGDEPAPSQEESATSVSVPVSPSDTLTMYFEFVAFISEHIVWLALILGSAPKGTMNDSAIPTVTKRLEGTEGIADLKVEVLEGIATVQLKKQTTVQATGVASGLVELIQGLGFKLQTLNLSFEDEEDLVVPSFESN